MHAQGHGAASAAAIESHAGTAAGGGARVIAIVGGGFCGTALAVQLLRQATTPATRIIVIEPRPELGAGVTYATRDYPYPLNVAAGQMSLDASVPGDFLDFTRAQGIHASAADYLPRQVYGEYLRARLAEARRGGSADFTHCRASVLQIRRLPEGSWRLALDDGTLLDAQVVVLAPGNPPPACPRECAALAGAARFIQDPLSLGALEGTEYESVLLIGSGLTMIDAALRLAALRPRIRHIHVLSRHGLLPLSQAVQTLPPARPDVSGALAQSAGSIRRLTREFRALTRAVIAGGGDWREVFALARGELPASWRGLDARERARFLRHARPLWDVHRHRAPAGALRAVQALSNSGVLDVHAGRIEHARPAPDGIEIEWRPRGEQRARAWFVDCVVNCTGPASRVDDIEDPLLRSLIAAGWLRSDPHGLGIDCAADGRPISRDGTPASGLYYLGPWLRARDWEATAVPELRAQALALARILAGSWACGATVSAG